MGWKTVNPLSTPKGHKFECELCGRTALLQCAHCRVTFYCGKDHLQLDWIGIHEKICQLLVPLRSQPLIIGSEEERVRLQANMQKSQRALIDLTRMEATKFLVHGNYEHAIPGAVQALRFSLDVYGAGRIELVPCHLLLAEANLGLGRQKQAEEYLSLANWSILKNPDCSNRLKSQLYRNFGKLYASQGKYDEALRQLANDIYFSSLQVGPDHVDTAGGFYYLATVFYLQKRIDCALAMCDKVVDTWYKHCKAHMTSKENSTQDPEPLGDAQVMEGLQILSKIVTLREEALGIEHVSAGEACYTLALLYQYAKDLSKARTLMKRALTVYRRELGDHHKSTGEVLQSLEQLGVSRVPSRASTAMGRSQGANGDFANVDEDEEEPVGGEENAAETSAAPEGEAIPEAPEGEAIENAQVEQTNEEGEVQQGTGEEEAEDANEQQNETADNVEETGEVDAQNDATANETTLNETTDSELQQQQQDESGVAPDENQGATDDSAVVESEQPPATEEAPTAVDEAPAPAEEASAAAEEAPPTIEEPPAPVEEAPPTTE